MSLILKIIDSWATRFDDSKYRREFYLQTLASFSKAEESEKIGKFVIRMLQWKDGKVQFDPTGSITVNGRRYAVSRTKPNTYDRKVYDTLFFSNHFFVWAQGIKKLCDFSSDLLDQIRSLGLWPRTSLVIPTFLLHILNPRVFPIFDQQVERARRFLMGKDLNASSVGLRIDDYNQHTLFRFELLSDVGINVATAEYDDVKHVDEALWAMGKHLKQTQKATKKQPTDPITAHRGNFTTSSPDFKNTVFKYAGIMKQSAAMEQAAREFGIHLPRSYLLYPGSHIDRWRRQGFPK